MLECSQQGTLQREHELTFRLLNESHRLLSLQNTHNTSDDHGVRLLCCRRRRRRRLVDMVCSFRATH